MARDHDALRVGTWLARRLRMARALMMVVVPGLVLLGCAVSKQYTLELDAKDPAKNRLCVRTPQDESSDEPDCSPYGSQTLEAPGTLAVRLVNATPTSMYHTRVEQVTRTPVTGTLSKTAAADIVKHWIIVRQKAIAAISGTKPDEAPSPEGKPLSRKDIDRLATVLVEDGANAAEKALQKRSDAKISSRPNPVALFGRSGGDVGYLRKPNAVALAEPVPLDDPAAVFGAPSHMYPPARQALLDETDLVHLTSHLGDRLKAEAALATHVREWCEPASFGRVPRHQPDTSWTEYVTSPEVRTLRLDDVLDDVPLESIAVVLREKLRAARNPTTVTTDARKVHALYAVGRLHSDFVNCSTNVDFARGLQGGVNQRRELESLKLRLDELVVATKSPAQIFEELVEPIVRRQIDEKLASVPSTLSFGTYSIVAGQIDVSVVEGQQPEDKHIAALQVAVSTQPRFTISVGPMMSFCPDCLVAADEQVRAGGEGAPDGTRLIVVNRDDRTLAFATMVNLGIAAVPGGQFGAGLGYALSQHSGVGQGAIAGLLYRHHLGFTIAAGVHVFDGKRLKSEYDDPSVENDKIDTSRPGFTGLSPETVLEGHVKGAFFVSLMLDSSLFETAE